MKNINLICFLLLIMTVNTRATNYTNIKILTQNEYNSNDFPFYLNKKNQYKSIQKNLIPNETLIKQISSDKEFIKLCKIHLAKSMVSNIISDQKAKGIETSTAEYLNYNSLLDFEYKYNSKLIAKYPLLKSLSNIEREEVIVKAIENIVSLGYNEVAACIGNWTESQGACMTTFSLATILIYRACMASSMAADLGLVVETAGTATAALVPVVTGELSGCLILAGASSALGCMTISISTFITCIRNEAGD